MRKGAPRLRCKMQQLCLPPACCGRPAQFSVPPGHRHSRLSIWRHPTRVKVCLMACKAMHGLRGGGGASHAVSRPAATQAARASHGRGRALAVAPRTLHQLQQQETSGPDNASLAPGDEVAAARGVGCVAATGHVFDRWCMERNPHRAMLGPQPRRAPPPFAPHISMHLRHPPHDRPPSHQASRTTQTQHRARQLEAGQHQLKLWGRRTRRQ